MNGRFKTLCCVMACITAFALLCVPAMAYQIKNAVSGDEASDQDVFSSEDVFTSSEYIEPEPSSEVASIDEPSEVISFDSVASFDYSSSGFESENTLSSDAMPSETSSVAELSSAEPASSYEEDDGDDYIEDYDYDYYVNDNVNYGDVYTSLYSVAQEDNRRVISGGNWSDISLDFEEDSTGSFVVKNTGKGDFSFIKDNKSDSDSSLYYWLAGGIAFIVIGLCGISFVIVLAIDKKKHTSSRVPVEYSRRSDKGNTAEIELPEDFDDNYNS